MKKSDKERLKKIVSTWNSLKEQIKEREITPEMLLQDEFSQWAVTTPLYNIGEQVYQLSNELKQAHTEQPWNMVAGLRHRLVHDYVCATGWCMTMTASTGALLSRSCFRIWTPLWRE